MSPINSSSPSCPSYLDKLPSKNQAETKEEKIHAIATSLFSKVQESFSDLKDAALFNLKEHPRALTVLTLGVAALAAGAFVTGTATTLPLLLTGAFVVSGVAIPIIAGASMYILAKEEIEFPGLSDHPSEVPPTAIPPKNEKTDVFKNKTKEFELEEFSEKNEIDSNKTLEELELENPIPRKKEIIDKESVDVKNEQYPNSIQELQPKEDAVKENLSWHERQDEEEEEEERPNLL